MALHTRLFKDISTIINDTTDKTPITPLDISGSLNYRAMSWGSWCILAIRDRLPTVDGNDKSLTRVANSTYIDRFQQFLDEQESIGHCTLSGPKGVACEQGSPGMHHTFTVVSVVGVLQECLRYDYPNGPYDKLINSCVRWLGHQARFNDHYRVGTLVAMPCPRVKDEKSQAPIDGYRDIMTSLIIDSTIDKSTSKLILPSFVTRRSSNFWRQTQSIGVRVLRDILMQHPDLLHDMRAVNDPKLYLPIERRPLADGSGFIAWIEKTQSNTTIMGKDVCNWVINRGRSGNDPQVEYGLDWKALPNVETMDA